MNIALLCFGISSISSVSGVEKVFVEMANAFAERGHTVYSIWNDNPGIYPYYPFDSRVHTVNLELGKIKAPIRYKILREIMKSLHIDIVNKVDQYKTQRLCSEFYKKIDINKIDVFVCYEFNSVMVANTLSKGKIPVIAMCHNSVEDQIQALTTLQRKEASRVDVYSVLMPSYVKEAEKFLTTKVLYIPNTVPQVEEKKQAKLKVNKDEYIIVNVGRIEGRQKRQMILVESFAKLAKKYPQWKVYLYGPVGDKEYKKQIDNIIFEHHLETQVIYKGITNRILDILSKCDIFAFPSAYEGFSLALTEAMSVGLPTIGFKYAPSVHELIKNNVNGYLAINNNDFTDKLEGLMKSKEKRIAFGAKARENMKTYSAENVWNMWENLLENLVNNKKGNR